jgi:RNA polymerase sigma-70 factor (ECF subfamily)
MKATGQAELPARAADAEDAGLIERINDGEHEAYGRLVEKYQDRLFNTCWRICGHLEDARDLTQEAFLRGFEKFETFRDQSSFYTWIYRVAMNLALTHRRNARRRRLPLDAAELGAAGTQADQLAQRAANVDTQTPEQSATEAERVQAAAHALHALDEDHRAVVVLRDIEGLDYDEIAEILQLPRGTVKSRLHRGRMALRSAIFGESESGSGTE